MRDLLARCLAKDPERRQRDAGDAALELRAALEGREWSAQPAAAAPRQRLRTAPVVVAALALAAVFTLRGDPEVEERPTLRFELQLPSPLGVSDRMMNEIAVAPDGTSLVYVTEEEDTVGVHLHDLSAGTSRRLALGRWPRGAIFSPDGRSLAFVQDYEQLAVVPLDGGAPRRIGAVEDLNGNGAWLEDGRIVLPSRNGHAIHAFPPDGSGPALLAEPGEELFGFENFSPVPGEDWFLADGWFGVTVDDYRIVAVDAESGSQELLLERASNPHAVGGRYLVFLRSASLMAVPFDFEARRILGEPELVVEGVATGQWGGTGQFALSPEGTLVYAPGRRRGEGRRIVWRSPGGESEPILPGTDAYVQGVQISRDGRLLLLNTLRHRREIWTLDLERGVLSPIDSPQEGYLGVFSADGTSVYFNSLELGSGVGRLRQAPVGGGPSRVIAEGRFWPTDVTPDGKMLVLTRAPRTGSDAGPESDTGSDVVTLELGREGAEPARLFEDAHNDSDARISPDGQWVAYISDRTGRPEVYVRPWAGGAEWCVTELGWSPRWGPDGKSLTYERERELIRVELELDPSVPSLSQGSRRTILSSLALAEEDAFAIGPDGRIAMIELADWEMEGDRLRVVVGWLAELDERFAGERR